MDCKIDYLAFTVPTHSGVASYSPQVWAYVNDQLSEYLPATWKPITEGHDWEVYKARGFYHTRVFDNHSKISVSFGETNAHIYVELGGQSCDHIRNLNLFEELCQQVASRASRVDFAVDFETDVQPEVFIVNNDRKAFKARSEVHSADGDTCYVGSWKGERFARVYRYHPPHPRSHLLRAEAVYRGDYAKTFVSLYLAEGIVPATLAAHLPFQWSHELWQPSTAEVSRIAAKRYDRDGAGLLRWLAQSVAPSLARAHKDGLLNLGEWLETFVYPLVKDE